MLHGWRTADRSRGVRSEPGAELGTEAKMDSSAAVDDPGGDEELVEVRMLVPRRALVQSAPAPELVSQANVLDALGIPPRRFLELVRSPRFPGRVRRSGRLRLVRRVDLLEHLEHEDEADRVDDVGDETPRRSTLAERLGLEDVRQRARRR